MTLEQFLKLIDIIQKESDATKLSESYEKQQNKQEVFIPTAGSTTTGKSTNKSKLSKEEEEDDDLDHLTRLITSAEIDSKFNSLNSKPNYY